MKHPLSWVGGGGGSPWLEGRGGFYEKNTGSPRTEMERT